MPAATSIQASFNAGELSPLLSGRIDLAKRQNGVGIMENFLPLVQGPTTGRPGTYFVNEVKSSANRTALVPFEFNTVQAYIIEFGDQYLRFYKNGGIIETAPSTPYEVATPYLLADLFDGDGRFQIGFAQSADVLYLAHPNYFPRKLSRTSDTSWTLSLIDFYDGPYGPINADTTFTITPSAATGAGITLTASAALFAATDVGRFVRIRHTATWGYAVIVGYTSATVVTADVVLDFGAATASDVWRLGLWSDTTGYPACVRFYEDRLVWGGGYAPQQIDASRTGDYENMQPSDPDSTVVDDHALQIVLNANDVNEIIWLSEDERGLLAGTSGGEWIIHSSSNGSVITPTDVQARRSTTYGSAKVWPQRAGKAVLFVQRAARKLREVSFVYNEDGYRANDMNLLAPHISRSGIIALAFQQEPYSVAWAVRADGVLLGLTYDKNNSVTGWHRHPIGGTTSTTSFGVVESIAVIPALAGGYDELWLIVNRRINGGTKRYVERLTKFFEEGDAQEDAFCVDGGLTYSGAPATVISGLDHLEGETVTVLADGATHPDKTVASGSITLDIRASKVHIGKRYVPTLESLEIEAGAANGPAQGKVKRIHGAAIRFYQTLGAWFGRDADNMNEVQFRSGYDPMDSPPPLFDGDKYAAMPGGYDRAGKWRIEQRDPLPITIVAVMPKVVTQD